MKTRHLYTAVIIAFISTTAIQCSKPTNIYSDTVTLNTYNNKLVGESSKELLTADKPIVVFEVNYMTGYPLQSSTISTISGFLNSYTNKGSYQLIQKEIAVTGKDSLTLKEIDLIERQNRTAFNTANQVAIYILVTDGKYNPPATLGISYRNTSIALFGKAIKSFSGGTNQISTAMLESGTLEHELGHLLGLVNLGSAMVTSHADPSNLKHCNNNKCLMYYQAETSQFLGRFMTTSIPPLDANCHADLIANGGK